MILDKASRKYYNEYVKKAYVNKVKFKKINKKYFTYESLEVRGLFFETEGEYVAEMHIALGDSFDEWFPIFVHETSHMDQFLENSIYWKKLCEAHLKIEEVYGEDTPWILEDITSTEKQYPHELLNYAIRAEVGAEWDCERRVLQKIKKYNLPIDAKKYIKKANSCLFVYPMLLYTNAWPQNEKIPYEDENVYGAMPAKLLPLRTYFDVPEEYKKLYLDNCY